MITLQAIFNAAWAHFIVGDGKPAYDTQEETCQYLTEDGNKCAVGLCIPDGHQAQKLLGDFQELVGTYPELFDQQIREMWKDVEDNGYSSKYSSPYASLHNFQSRLHDSMINRVTGSWILSKEQMKDGYLKIAEQYNLTVPA